MNIDKPLNSPEARFPLGLRSWIPAGPVSLICPPGVFPICYSTEPTVHTNHPACLPPASLLFTAAAQEKDLVKAHHGTRFVGVCGGHADQVQGVQNGPWCCLLFPLWSLELLSEPRSAVELHRPPPPYLGLVTIGPCDNKQHTRAQCVGTSQKPVCGGGSQPVCLLPGFSRMVKRPLCL